MNDLKFRIPDIIFWILASIVTIVTWFMLIYLYPELPDKITTHFSLNGTPDNFSDKSWWTVLFPGILQLVITGGFAWLYRHPKYSSIPGTLWLERFPEPARTKLISLVKHQLVMLVVLMDLLFAYIGLSTVTTALEITSGLTGWAIGLLIGMIILVAVVYTIWMIHLTKKLLPSPESKQP